MHNNDCDHRLYDALIRAGLAPIGNADESLQACHLPSRRPVPDWCAGPFFDHREDWTHPDRPGVTVCVWHTYDASVEYATDGLRSKMPAGIAWGWYSPSWYQPDASVGIAWHPDLPATTRAVLAQFRLDA